ASRPPRSPRAPAPCAAVPWARRSSSPPAGRYARTRPARRRSSAAPDTRASRRPTASPCACSGRSPPGGRPAPPPWAGAARPSSVDHLADGGADLLDRAAVAAAEDGVDAAALVARPARDDVDVDVRDRLAGAFAVVDADGRAGRADGLAHGARQ